MSKTEVMGVRVERADWDAFGAKCLKAGTTRNAMLVAFIKSELIATKPLTKTPQSKGDRPIGFDAATGEPIFKRGVGPQKGKK